MLIVPTAEAPRLGPSFALIPPERRESTIADFLRLTSDRAAAECHCGKPVAYGFYGDPTHTRGMCDHCDSVRCDAYPGECALERGAGR